MPENNKGQSFDLLFITALYLTMIFTALRACDVTDWTWWQVLMPQFIYIGLVLVITVVVAIGLIMEEKRK